MRFAVPLLILLCLAGPARAVDYSGAWVAQLRAEGYEDIEVGRTWLGRIRIVAEKDEIEREIILNRATGEVLRDFSRAEDGGFRLPLGFDIDLDDFDDDDDDDDDDHGDDDD
jgi:hypothetical protein